MFPLSFLSFQDQQVLDDVQSLSDYILDELNVKKLTLSTKKQDYGVMLRAEPDHKTLGFRYLTDHKTSPSIKASPMTSLSQSIKVIEIESLCLPKL